MGHLFSSDGQIVAVITGAFLAGNKCFEVWQSRYGAKITAEQSEKQQLWVRIAQVENSKTQVEQSALEREKTLRQELATMERERDEWKRHAEASDANNRQLAWHLFVQKGETLKDGDTSKDIASAELLEAQGLALVRSLPLP